MWLSGLVRAYLAIPKHKEALCAAREAMKAMPQSAKALTLVGDVYAHHPDGRDKVSLKINYSGDSRADEINWHAACFFVLGVYGLHCCGVDSCLVLIAGKEIL
jgi:hypothetical protein